MRATCVPKKDWIGQSDPYLKLWVRNRIQRRTHTVMNNANPEWGEEFEFLVHTRQHQVGEGWLLQPGVRACLLQPTRSGGRSSSS